MKEFFRNGAGGIAGLLGISLCDGIATTVAPSVGVQQFASNITVICTVAVAITTCALQIYTMIRNRNKDKAEAQKAEAEKAAKAAEGEKE